jgi:hypothetical protein
MEKNVTKIIDHLITTADLICWDTSKGGFPKDESQADVARFCLSQQDDADNDKTAGGILREHGLTVWDLRFLDKQGVLIEHDWDIEDAPGSIIDDRTLHVSVWKKDVLKFSTIDQRHWGEVW